MKFLLLFTFLISFTSIKEVDLKLNLNPGETYTHKYKVDADVKQEINGQPINVEMAIDSEVSFKILEKTNSGYKTEMSYQRIAMDMQSPMGSMSFDSDDTESTDVFARLLSKMIDYKLLTTINFDGTIAEVKNIDKMYKAMFDEFPEIPQAQQTQLESQLRQSFGEKAIASNIEMATAIFPKEKVNEGDTWENTIEMKGSMEGTMNNTFTLKELTDEYALIDRNATITTDATEKMVNGMPATYDLKGNLTSTLKVHPQTGWILEADIDQTLGGTVNIKDNAQVPGGLSFPMEISSTTEISN